MTQVGLGVFEASDSAECWGAFDYTTTIILIILSCALGIGWAVFNFIQVRKINVAEGSSSSRDNLVDPVSDKQRELIIELGDKIANVLSDPCRAQWSF
jgi:uncharacterized protein HemX